MTHPGGGVLGCEEDCEACEACEDCEDCEACVGCATDDVAPSSPCFLSLCPLAFVYFSLSSLFRSGEYDLHF